MRSAAFLSCKRRRNIRPVARSPASVDGLRADEAAKKHGHIVESVVLIFPKELAGGRVRAVGKNCKALVEQRQFAFRKEPVQCAKFQSVDTLLREKERKARSTTWVRVRGEWVFAVRNSIWRSLSFACHRVRRERI